MTQLLVFYQKYRIIIITAGLFLLFALVASIVHYFPPEQYGKFYPKCYFYEFTGIYCPGCGNTRAMTALLHGELLKSLSCNILLLPTIGVLYALLIRPKLAMNPTFAKTIFFVIAIFLLFRNLPWYPFTLLAPH